MTWKNPFYHANQVCLPSEIQTTMILKEKERLCYVVHDRWRGW